MLLLHNKRYDRIIFPFIWSTSIGKRYDRIIFPFIWSTSIGNTIYGKLDKELFFSTSNSYQGSKGAVISSSLEQEKMDANIAKEQAMDAKEQAMDRGKRARNRLFTSQKRTKTSCGIALNWSPNSYKD